MRLRKPEEESWAESSCGFRSQRRYAAGALSPAYPIRYSRHKRGIAIHTLWSLYNSRHAAIERKGKMAMIPALTRDPLRRISTSRAAHLQPDIFHLYASWPAVASHSD
jgi:hypothetical protein